MQLASDPRFLKEFEQFKQSIDELTDGKMKTECQQLLKQMLQTVKTIDQQHGELPYTPRITEAMSEHRTKLFDLRKQLSKRLIK